jgi:cell division protein FtsW
MNGKITFQPARYIDPVLLFAVTILTGIGVIMVYSASSELALRQFGNEYYFFSRQMAYLAVGMTGMTVACFVPYKIYRPFSYGILVLSLILLGVLLISGIGHTAGGATRWLRISWVSFQPAEFARLALIIFFAYSLAKKQELVEQAAIGFFPHVIVLSLFSLLIMMQPDFGTIVILWMMAWAIMFVGRVRVLHLVLAFVLVLPLAAALLVSAEYRVKRYITFLDPFKYPLDEGYQIIHAMMAFNTGGVFGQGFGEGYQKLFYLPAPHTDFIFSVLGEEGGLLLVLTVIALFLVILWRGLQIAAATQDSFGSFLAFGISASIAIQAVINMGVNLALLPTKGLTLPFLSFGGSSLVFNLVSIGILMNIGKSIREIRVKS